MSVILNPPEGYPGWLEALLDTHWERSPLIPSATAELTALRAEVKRLQEALESACILRHGKACFFTHGGVPMDMPPTAERIVRAALEEKTDAKP